jgi:energy-coupling factor transporter ATP-binding protein EcfA2
MKLYRLRIRNFRCFQNEISIDFDDMTALVGKNDAGKSSLMEALDIFLNDVTPDKDDATKGGDAKDLTIICQFTDLPAKVIIDDANPTCLSEEFLLNEEGRLEIHKNYSGQLASPKLVSVCAWAIHPTADGAADLLQLKNSALKKRAQELGVDLAGVDQKINAGLRGRIRQHVGDLALAPILVPLNENNAKDIWAGLKAYLPAFALFKSDRPSTDQDPEAQDPLKAAVKEAIKAKQADLEAIAAHVETEVRKIAKATLDKLSEMDPTLATQLNPQFSPPRWESLFKASFTGDNDIPVNKRGSGVKRLILLNFFRAKAEQKARETKRSDVIYGIEEPETSQHPNNQRMLLRALMDLSTEYQVILSTHTPMLARALPDRSLRYVNIAPDGSREVLVGGNETNQLFVRSLGVLPDNTVKLFIGVEGKHDIAFLQTISKSLLNSGVDVSDLEKLEIDGEIIFFPLGGSTLVLWTSRLENLNRPEFHLYDRDTAPPAQPKYHAEVEAVNQREACCARSTLKKEMENYLHWEAIKQAYSDFNIDIQINQNFGPFDDVPVGVARMVHEASASPYQWDQLDDDKKEEKERRAKRILNFMAAKHMTQEFLAEIDPDGDLLDWFREIRELLA